MKRQIKVRLCLALFILASVLGLGFTGSEATAAACCESCDNVFQGCLTGSSFYPACGGDPSCCSSKVEPCYDGCVYC